MRARREGHYVGLPLALHRVLHKGSKMSYVLFYML